jgi:hypothetical protein
VIQLYIFDSKAWSGQHKARDYLRLLEQLENKIKNNNISLKWAIKRI